MIRYVLKLEDLGNGKTRIVKPNGPIEIPDEEDLGELDLADVDVGMYLVLGPKVRQWTEPIPLEQAKTELRQLHGSEGKGILKLEKYQVFRIQ